MSKSRITLEASQLNDDDHWAEAWLCIEREDEPDPELKSQDVFMTPVEMETVYKRLKTYYEQGIWSMGSVDR